MSIGRAGSENRLMNRLKNRRVSAMQRLRVAAVAILGAGLCLVAPGCSISHHEFGHAVPDTSGLQIGVTTKAEVLTRLGPPLEIRRQFDGDLFIYRRVTSDSSQLLLVPLFPIYANQQGESVNELVTLLFDEAGVLAGVGRHVP